MIAALRIALTMARLLAAQTLRHLAVTAVLCGLAFMFLLIGMIGFLVALWIWLLRHVDPISAALIIGGGGVFLALLMLLIARNRRMPSLLSSSIAVDLEAAVKDQKATIEVWGPLIGVALLGFLMGSKPKD